MTEKTKLIDLYNNSYRGIPHKDIIYEKVAKAMKENLRKYIHRLYLDDSDYIIERHQTKYSCNNLLERGGYINIISKEYTDIIDYIYKQGLKLKVYGHIFNTERELELLITWP